MIKALAISDVHLNQSRRIDDVSSALDRVVELVVKLGVGKLFVLGDYFTSRRPTSKELKIFEKWVYEIRKYNSIELYLLRGNHDESPTGEHSYHAIEAFEFSNVHVLENPSVVDNIFLGHILLMGAKLGRDGWENNTGLTARKLIEKYPSHRAYILGDVHAPQQLLDYPLVAYCGSIEKVDFSERDDQKRAIYLEYELDNPLSFRWQSIPLKTRPMIQYDINASFGDTIAFKQPNECEGAIVKVVVHGTREEIKKIDVGKIRQVLSGAKELTIQYDIKKEFVARDSEMRESLSPTQALRHYLDKLQIPSEEREEILKLSKGVMFDA